MQELPMVPSGPPACPAAAKVGGVTAELQGVICRVMQREHREQDPTGLDAGSYGHIVHEATGGVYLNLASDPTSVVRFCHGHDLPVLDDADGYRHDTYTYCPVWQAEKDRIFEGRHSAVQDPEPEPVSMGMAEDSLSASDPWAAAHRGLDALAPVTR